MPEGAQKHVPGLDILVDGAALGPEWRNTTTEIKVVSSLQLPDMAVIRLTDPQGKHVDDHPLQLGKQVEIKTAAAEAQTTTSIFKGDVVAVEPEFGQQGVEIVIRAYDRAYKLNRERKTRTFQQMSASDMVQKLAGDAGLSADVTSTDVIHEFFQQSNETDWDFSWRLALMHDYEVIVEDKSLKFQPANETEGSTVELKWQDTLISFKPRMSGIQQLKTVNVRAWDPKSAANINGSASQPKTSSTAGLSQSTVSGKFNGGTTMVADRIAENSSEANAIAKSTLQRMSDAYYEADGVAMGNPSLKAGAKVKISNVGDQFGGTYTVSGATHIYRGSMGYRTHFQISGRSARTLLELTQAPKDREWSRSLVVGVVTNNNDPESMGRIRVKYPSLSDSEESAWARIATPSAGNARGVLMLPQSGDEVIIGFEHGDTRRPIVVGSVFNGKGKPGEELIQNKDGSFAVLSDQKIHQHSKQDFEIKSDQNMTVEVQSNKTETIKGNYKNEATGNGNLKAQQYVIEAGSAMTVKGVSVTVEASASLTLKGATVNIQGSGPVNISGAIINLG